MKLTNQTAFNQVAEHLIKQGRKATDINSPCMYQIKLEDGTILKCAIGCLIPDHLYEKRFEGRTIGRLLLENEVDELAAHLDNVDYLLLEDLQAAHDYAGNNKEAVVENFKASLLNVAKTFKLEPPTCLQ